MTTADYNLCVDEYSDGVFRFILKNIKDEEKAKDVVQDAFEKMWNKIDEIDGEKAKSYLFTTAYHTMIDRIRRDKKQAPMDDAHISSLGMESGYSDLKEILNEAIGKLPEIQRNVVLLRDYEGYSYKEIGDIVNITESQVKVYIYRARVFLKKYICSMDMVI